MEILQKEIVLLPYPFTDLTESKVRPAIVVSNDNFNRKSNDFIAIPITAVIKDEPYSTILDGKDLVSGTLVKISRARSDKIFTFEKKLVVMKIGKLNNNAFNRIKSELIKVF